MKLPRAAIDVGSNSLLLLVVGPEGETLHDEMRIVGLGTGLGDRGHFRSDRRQAAKRVFLDFARTVQRLGVAPHQVLAVATSAARRAVDARAFFDSVQRETGLQIHIIDGEEEARLTWAGAFVGLSGTTGSRAVVDLGGGSTEVATGGSQDLGSRVSLEIGSVRLTERFLAGGLSPTGRRQLEQLEAHVSTVLEPLDTLPSPDQVVAVAGTATTLCAMDAGLRHWDRDRVHGRALSMDALRTWRDRLAEADLAERRRLAAVSPDRAPFLVAGATILTEVCTRLGRTELIASDGGVRHGLLVRGSSHS